MPENPRPERATEPKGPKRGTVVLGKVYIEPTGDRIFGNAKIGALRPDATDVRPNQREDHVFHDMPPGVFIMRNQRGNENLVVGPAVGFRIWV